MESKVSEKNRSSTEVGSFKELNLSYTFNLYIPGMTNSQQQVHALGSFSSCRCHSAMGIQPLLCQPWPSADLSLLHLPGAWQRKATTGSCLKLDYFYITVKKLRVNDKSSQEKQVLMCTSTEKISTAITKVHSERKKKTINQWEKLPQFAPNLWSTDKIKTKPKLYQETSPQKSTVFISVLFGNFCSL